ncbi:MAG: leucine--tRNA ligase [Clostridia bacterium]|nr:leucine--tRNA ligase [Clostridia bacterium]
MYNKDEIEKKWREYWEKHNTFACDVYDFSKPKYYCLDMFPYPSGVGLHAGHAEGYTATDIVARMKRMQGFNVLHPMGYDAFGLPAEQYAISTGNHPAKFTYKNIETFREQLKLLGFSYNWEKEIATCDPSYYKWEQWIFKQLYKDGLAKEVEVPVNWCEELGTVLANDEVIDGKSERGGYPVVRKNMKQWIIDIPKYADRLLDGLNHIDWPESTKEIQRNWIGKSEGVELEVEIVGGGKFSIFTTCIETVYGITFFVIAPDGKIIQDLLPRVENRKEVEEYIKETSFKSNMDRTELNKGKTGVEVKGIKAINPISHKEVPIFLGDFVLGNYGTGAVMAVPAHDQRDYEYAKAHNLPIVEVIEGGDISKQAFEKHDYLGKNCKLVNSEEFSGLVVEEAKEKITDKLVNQGIAKRVNNYKIREWIFARQRYWGAPIPVVHYADGSTDVLDDADLPLELPELEDYSPAKNGSSALSRKADWVNIVYHGKPATRETSTMPGSADSSWYFLIYIDPQNDKEIADKKLLDHWMPVDLYVGGPEHAVGHLLYSRMWNNYLYDKGYVPCKEPFQKLVHQGMVLGANGIKMGKRYPEFCVNPNDVVKQYGADTLRLYEMFMGPLEADKPWSEQGVEGARRYLDRVWRLVIEDGKVKDQDNPNLEKIYHQTIKKVTEDYQSLNFNTAISQMMIFTNACYKEDVLPKYMAEGFVKLLNPIVPFITEEMWQLLGHDNTIAYEPWPVFDPAKIVEDMVTIAVSVNGKFKARVEVPLDASNEEVMQVVKNNDTVKRNLDGKEILKEIVVPNKIVNIVVK